jgi:hypothetical protein
MNMPLCLVLCAMIFAMTGCGLTGSPGAERDRRAQQAVEGTKAKRYYMRLEPFPIREAPSEAVVSTPTMTLPAGRPLEVRVNCGMDLHDGGWQYRDEQGRIWLADRTWRPGAQWGVQGAFPHGRGLAR